MRKSLEGLMHMVKDIEYSGNLPDALKPFHVYIVDCGHCIMGVPNEFRDEVGIPKDFLHMFIKPELWDVLGGNDSYKYEVPIPVQFVLNNDFWVMGDCVYVDVLYDRVLGVQVDEEYYEFDVRENPMHSESDNALTMHEVGKPYSGAIPYAEGGYFDMTDSGGQLTVFYNRPNAKEIDNIRKGELKVALTVKDGCIFLLVKFGDLPWMDMPYNAHLSKNLSKLEEPNSTESYGLLVTLVDVSNREVKAIRLLGLPNRLSVTLKRAIEEQLRTPPVSSYENNVRVDAIYRRYRTKDLLSFASVQQCC